MSHAVTIITPPAELPVTVPDLKEHLRIRSDDGSQDVMLSNLIGAATQVFERETQTSVVVRMLRLSLDSFPAVIFLPRGPVLSIESVTYLNTEGIPTTLDPADYVADTDHQPARLAPPPTASWPQARRMLGAVTVDYEAGHGLAPDVPDDIKAAILMIATTLFENPAAATQLKLSNVPFAVEAIINNHRMPGGVA